MSASTGTEDYYRERAPWYDEIYTRPERQADLGVLRQRLTEWFAGKRVLEVAAGTGWWTDVLADTAASVTATDVNQATLDVAMGRREWPESVRFVIADAFALGSVTGEFDAAYAGFFWSHVPLPDLDGFLEGLLDRVQPGSLVAFMDNRMVPGSVHPVVRRDEQGNTYQQRRMKDGRPWEVLKNFPEPDELLERLGRFGEAGVEMLDYFWLAWVTRP
jgi:SAM-dependent methyltransferase